MIFVSIGVYIKGKILVNGLSLGKNVIFDRIFEGTYVWAIFLKIRQKMTVYIIQVPGEPCKPSKLGDSPWSFLQMYP